jgi:hypothetical protein
MEKAELLLILIRRHNSGLLLKRAQMVRTALQALGRRAQMFLLLAATL